MKKFISILSALAISASLMPMSIMAETLPETIWYENTFDNGREDLTWETDSEYFDGGYNTDSVYLEESIIDGNKGMKSNNSGAYKVKQTFFYDFKKGGENEGLNTGKLKFSFDFKMIETSTADAVGVGINMSKDGADPTEGNLAMQLDRVTGEDGVTLGRIRTKKDAASYNCDDSNSMTDTFDLKGVHTLEIILNLNNNDNARFNYYLDGERIGNDTRYWGVNVNNLALALNGQFEYVDNIKLSMLNADSAYSFTADAKYANGYVDVDFGAAMDVAKGTFTVDGETADSVDWLDLNTARVYSEALYEGGTHTVTVADAQDLYGVAPQNNEVSVSTEVLLPEEVLYQNDFSSATIYEALAEYENDYLKVPGYYQGTNEAGETVWKENIDGGNPSLSNGVLKMSNQGAYPTGRTLVFDFTKGGIIDGISMGIVKVSYDISLRKNTNSVPTANSGVNMTNHWQGGIMMGVKTGSESGTICTKNTFGQYDASENPVTVNLGQVYRVDVILDATNKTAVYYLDGVKLAGGSSIANYVPIKNFTIVMSGTINSIDNIKISKLDETAEHQYSAEVAENQVNLGYVDVTFPNAVMDMTKGEFLVDGAVASKVEWKAVDKVRVYSEALNTPGEHTVAFEDVTDKFGVAPRKSFLIINTVTWDNEYILYESTFDNGNSDLYWTEENPAFTGGHNATKPEGAEYPIGGVKPSSARFGGNMGIGYHNGAWPAGTTFWYDFTKGGTQDAPTSGKMKFSFDFIMQKTSEPEGAAFIKNSPNNTTTSSWSGGGFIQKNEKPYLITWDGSGSDFLIKTDVDAFGTELDYEIHTLDIVIQHGGHAYLNYYLDGVKMPKVFNYWESAKHFGFAMSGVLKYVDNVKLSYIKDGSFGVESLKAPKAGDETLTLYTTEQADALTTNDVLVTVNGETVTPTDVLVKTNPGSMNNDTRYAVEITLPESAAEGDEYTVTLADTAKSVMGYKVNAKYNNAQAQALAVEDVKTSLAIEDGVAKAVVVNNEDKAINPVMIIARYDEEGRFEGMTAYKGYTIDGFGVKEIPAGEVAELQYNVGNLSGDVKVMLVSDYKTMSPMTPSVEN